MLAAALWSAPCFAQSSAQLGPLCTTEATPADQQIDACNKIIALKVFSGEKLATIYFWRAVGWNKKGNYAQVIADATEAMQLQAQQSRSTICAARPITTRASTTSRSPTSTTRCGSDRPAASSFTTAATPVAARATTPRRSPTTTPAIKARTRRQRISYQNRGASKQALGDLDGALADINEAIRIDPALPQPLINRAVIWRAKGDIDRAIADSTEAIRLAKAKAPVNIMTPPGSVLISAYIQRGLAYEAKGDFDQREAGLRRRARRRRLRRRQQGQPGHRQGAALAAADAGSAANRDGRRHAPAHEARATPPAATGRRVALVIGNGAYAHVKALPNPPNDARAIAKSLRDIGFDGHRRHRPRPRRDAEDDP